MAKLRSVVKNPPVNGLSYPGDSFLITLATVADDIAAWGTRPRERDIQLRNFWPTEPLFASALFSTVSRYASFGWSLEGPPRTTGIVQELLHGVDKGRGWLHFITKILIDLFTQDNGAFIETVRAEDKPNSPVLSLNHLDSNRCVRTGNPETPVYYTDLDSNTHLLKAHHVITLEEFPSPVETMRGMQYCCLTRILRAAQVMRDISVYKREKVSGRFARAVHLVGGVNKTQLADAIKLAESNADNAGLVRYMTPIVATALDPKATVSKETIELASMPDNFDEDVAMRWYISQMALAFGTDYQDFAPLPGNNMGSSQQSQVMHLKSRGKGPALFMKMLEHIFNFHGVMPGTVRFSFGEIDVAYNMEVVNLRKARAQERQIRIASGEITTDVARQMAIDAGDLTETELAMMEQKDQSPDIKLGASVPPPLPVGKPTETEPGPKGPPTAAGKPSLDSQVNPEERADAPAKTEPKTAGKVKAWLFGSR